MDKNFQFYTEYNLPILLGLKAKNLKEIVEHIKSVPASSIYYHTHRFLQEHHYLVPEPPNDFAYWIRTVLNFTELGELVASIDIASYKNIEDVRYKLIEQIENYPFKEEIYNVNCFPGNEFQFMSCRTFCLRLNYTAGNLKEFTEIMEKISIFTLFYHIFETQLRLGKKRNDFAEWFDSLGYTELGEKISRLDPYTTTLEGLREDIITLVKCYDTDN